MNSAFELKEWQKVPLDWKIEKTVDILERHRNDRLYLSLSGGLGSTVLSHIADESRIRKPKVFIDTGLEYPEVRKHALSYNLYEILKPDVPFKQVIEEYGYPIISKGQSMALRKLRTMNLSDKYRNKLLNGDERGSFGKLANRWKHLLHAPFKISEQCCSLLKKNPAMKLEKRDKCFPITAEMAEESQDRKRVWMQYGCSITKTKRPKLTPMAFWTQQDILQYIKKYNIPYASVYGQIKAKNNGDLYTTGEQRTGCMFCIFGCHLEEGENRFQRMQRTHPELYNYCINKLGIGEVLDYLGVEYRSQITIHDYLKMISPKGSFN